MPISATDAPKNLPSHAKEIYVAARNNAYGSTCKGRSDRDECASKIAWGAVKEKYRQEGDTWVSKKAIPSLKLVSQDRVGGYLLMWGSPEEKDLVNEFFTPETDFWLDKWNRRPLLYQHGLDGVLKGTESVVGIVDDYELDEIGLWIVAQLDMRHRYKDAITTLITEKALNLSSGALPRYVERSPDGFIKTWPIVEATLTPTPAEYRLADVVIVKAAFEIIGEEFNEKEEDKMDEKTLWEKLGVKLGLVGDDDAKAKFQAKEKDDEDEEENGKDKDKDKEEKEKDKKDKDKEKDKKKSTSLPEFVLDESAVKAISMQVASTMQGVFDGMTTELKELKAWRESVTSRLEATEKRIHDTAMEIVNGLPPIVKVRATEVKTEGDAPVAPAATPGMPGDRQAWFDLVEGIVERGLSKG